jgi:hypothetical protein
MHIRFCFAFLASAGMALANLHWESAVQEFERVPEDGSVTAKYAFKNTGSEPVTIRRVQTSCGCTSAKLTKTTFAPGESGEIEVKFTFGSRRGLQRKLISVKGDKDQEWRLDLRCNIRETVTINPAFVFWRIHSDPAEQSIRIVCEPSAGVKVTGVKSSSPRLAANLTTAKPGEEYIVTVKPTDTSQKEAAELTIETNFPPDAPRSYRVFARIR